jgi:DtxR family Mn-dependent transcriptional regulator
MRKHRLAERLLLDVIGLDWDQVHIEACRWEHVMSDAVERRILALLDKPLVCPHGNPIPGLDDLGLPFGQRPRQLSTLTLRAAATQSRTDPTSVVIERISEQIQPDDVLMRRLIAAQVLPGSALYVTGLSDGVEVWQEGAEHTALDRLTAEHVFVTAA